MGTRSLIAVLLPTGEVKGIYCQYDGYPDETLTGGVGYHLKNHYQDLDKVNELINLGDLSALGLDIASCKFFHGEGCDAILHKNTGTWQNYMKKSGCEYAYLYKAETDDNLNKWRCYNARTGNAYKGRF